MKNIVLPASLEQAIEARIGMASEPLQYALKWQEAETESKAVDEFAWAEKESSVEQSNAEKGRTEQRHLAEIVKIEADVESAKFKLDTAQERLADLREQLDACVKQCRGMG